MNNVIVDKWEFCTSTTTQATVLPDGCRDVILRTLPGDGSIQRHISPYFHSAKTVKVSAGSHSRGFRLYPGAIIDERGLLANLQHSELSVIDLINEFVSISNNTIDALTCLANTPLSVTQAAKEAGVHARTLQRLIFKETGLKPNYWLRLGRIRKAGRLIAENHSLAEIAVSTGYSDQSHLTRECVHWFGVTPTNLRQRPDLFEQLEHPAFS